MEIEDSFNMMISFSVIWSFGQFYVDSKETLQTEKTSKVLRQKICRIYNSFPME